MRYLVHAQLKKEKARDLLRAIETGTLGQGSIAGGEYLRDMAHARQCEDGSVRWVEVCYCPTPLMEEKPYWEEYFELTRILDAHDRRKCRDWNGQEPWACSNCDCTERLEDALRGWGPRFVDLLCEEVGDQVERTAK
ncbi:MAG TPA: hypothetical protein VK879_02875 [Candidatus Sulfomarinibacteraceae bacterium]|nr:hypothetical protein [Candidatus Sulfomarinibacteraceae bacterium]